MLRSPQDMSRLVRQPSPSLPTKSSLEETWAISARRLDAGGFATPILRKDFIISPYQLLQAKLVGADAVLLIAAVLTPAECRELARLAHELKLEVLLEIHDESELEHLNDDIDLLGVNNRHLGTFHTDTIRSFLLAERLPSHLPWVSESGIAHPKTLRQLRKAGYQGFLIGETFMKTPQPHTTLANFIRSCL